MVNFLENLSRNRVFLLGDRLSAGWISGPISFCQLTPSMQKGLGERKNAKSFGWLVTALGQNIEQQGWTDFILLTSSLNSKEFGGK